MIRAEDTRGACDVLRVAAAAAQEVLVMVGYGVVMRTAALGARPRYAVEDAVGSGRHCSPWMADDGGSRARHAEVVRELRVQQSLADVQYAEREGLVVWNSLLALGSYQTLRYRWWRMQVQVDHIVRTGAESAEHGQAPRLVLAGADLDVESDIDLEKRRKDDVDGGALPSL